MAPPALPQVPTAAFERIQRLLALPASCQARCTHRLCSPVYRLQTHLGGALFATRDIGPQQGRRGRKNDMTLRAIKAMRHMPAAPRRFKAGVTQSVNHLAQASGMV